MSEDRFRLLNFFFQISESINVTEEKDKEKKKLAFLKKYFERFGEKYFLQLVCIYFDETIIPFSISLSCILPT